MILQSQSNLIFLGEENKTAQSGNAYTVVKIGNPDKYENYTFYKNDNVKTDGLKQGDKIKATLEVVPQGFRNNINLTHVQPL